MYYNAGVQIVRLRSGLQRSPLLTSVAWIEEWWVKNPPYKLLPDKHNYAWIRSLQIHCRLRL
jgi:hypothetical protein